VSPILDSPNLDGADQDGGGETDTGNADHRIVQAIGEELRRARTAAGWSRPQLVKRVKSRVPVNTYACYEQGIRQCSVPRLLELCDALGVAATELIGLALQRLEHQVAIHGVRLDLRKITADGRDELGDLRRWARKRITEHGDTPDPYGPFVVHLPWTVMREVALICDLPTTLLAGHVQEFAPDSAQRQSNTAGMPSAGGAEHTEPVR
jgi:transcriptional regulator with XRE-family HTH domain